MKIKAILCAVLLFIAFVTDAQQFNVISPDNSGPGTLRQAIDDAKVYANTGTGQDAIISFRVASGLCQITSTLPDIDILKGSITFENAFQYPAVQGMHYTSTLALLPISNGLTSSVTIKNLKILTDDPNQLFNVYGLDMVYASNVVVKKCVFDIYRISINIVGCKNVLVDSNTFIGLYNNLSISNDPNMTNVNITNNSFTDSGLGVSMAENNSQGTINIENNIFNNSSLIVNLHGLVGDPLTKLLVKKNTFSGAVGAITLWGSLTYWVFEDNIFNMSKPANAFNIRSVPINASISHLSGFYLINSNTLNYPVFNKGNQIHYTNPINERPEAIEADIAFDNVLIVGYEIEGYILVTSGYKLIVRETKFYQYGSRPIILSSISPMGNNGIAKPELLNKSINGTNLTINYTLNGLNQSNGNFIVDFYKSNQNGDLLDYLGNQTINTLTGSTYSATLSGVSLSDRIAATITSVGGPSGNIAIGTSEVAYTPNCTSVTPSVVIGITSGTNPTCSGAALTLKATPTNGGSNPTYQWQKDGVNLSGETSDTYTSTSHGDGYHLTCIMTSNATCASPSQVTSNDITIFVNDGSNLQIVSSPVPACVGTEIEFGLFHAAPPTSATWIYGDGLSSGERFHTYTASGTYTVTLKFQNDECAISLTKQIVVNDCPKLECKDCVGSFAPIPGEKYVISAWVQESNGKKETTYAAPAIKITFLDGTSNVLEVIENIKGKGQIIDDWQRIEQEFVINSATAKIKIDLINTVEDKDVYFDDIRIHPFNSNLKSFVYDPLTLRLSAELDANNYATFYEYDEDGALVRVKKETERGIVTVKETRNNTKK